MCGLAGIINRKSVPVKDYSTLDRMLYRIKHRGPDDFGICGISLNGFLHNVSNTKEIQENVKGILGFNRLSIQDTTYAGHQPMQSLDQSAVITFNGEVYNVNELRQELETDTTGLHFRGRSDTEVIMNMYQRYGFYETIRKLNGMFAIVIYDTKKNVLYIARDRYGIIPLHLYIDEEQIIWASEIKAFLEVTKFKRDINYDSVMLNTRYCYPNESLFKQIDNMEPGTIIEWNGDCDVIKNVQYYNINEYEQRGFDKNINYLEEAENVLSECVNRQLVGDVELGVQLSGGVDSTLLTNLVSKEFKKNNCHLNGYSMTNHDSPGYDEEKWIDYVTDLNYINNHKVDMGFNRFIEGMEHSIYAFERPFYTLPPVGIYLFSKLANKDVKILTSGEGADEVAGGYPELFGTYYSYSKLHSHGKSIPKEYDCVNGGIDFIRYFDRIKQMGSCDDLRIDANIDEIMENRYEYWNTLTGTSFDKMRKMHFKYRLISMCERQNKVCMANSIENRVPFLDNKFVDYMFTIPEELLMFKNRNCMDEKMSTQYEGKYLLKRMSAEIYGSEFAYRKKQAIHAPLNKYFEESEMKNYIQDYILPGMKKRNMIDIDSFQHRLTNLNNNENVVSVWKYVNLELWCQFFIDGRTEFYA